MAKLSRNVAIALFVMVGMLTASPGITAFNRDSVTVR